MSIDALKRNLKCCNCQSTLSFESIEGETRKGLHSVFTIICDQCKIANRVDTGTFHEVNNEARLHLTDKTHNDLTTNAVLGK